MSGTTVSIAYRIGLKQRTSPLPHESGHGARGREPGSDAAGPTEVISRPVVAYTSPLPLVARSVAWLAGSSSEAATRMRSAASSHRTRDGRYPYPTVA